MKIALILLLLCVLNDVSGRWPRRNKFMDYPREKSYPAVYTIEQECDYMNWLFKDLSETSRPSSILSSGELGGIICYKEHENIRVLTICTYMEVSDISYHTPEQLGSVYFSLSVISERPSHISTCNIFEVYLRSWDEKCYIVSINGILMCTDQPDSMPGYHNVTLYPTIADDKYKPIKYHICATKMEMDFCPESPKVPSHLEFAEVGAFSNWAFG